MMRYKNAILALLLLLTVCHTRAVVTSGLDGYTTESIKTTPGVPVMGVDHDGVGVMIVEQGVTNLNTGSLLWDGRHILTAAHCVTDILGEINVRADIDSRITFNLSGGDQTYTFRKDAVSVHPNWTGETGDGFDLAIIDLGQTVNAGVTRYSIYDGPTSALQFSTQLFFGYGFTGTGDTGAAGGLDLMKRWGMNAYEDFIPSLATLYFDFDNGFEANDFYGHFFAPDPDFQDTGLGGPEANTAPGDSGGPHFIEDPFNAGTFLIGGVTSYGSRAEEVGTDIDEEINSTFGEFSVDASVADGASWIYSVVPEPEVYAALIGLLALAVCFRRKA